MTELRVSKTCAESFSPFLTALFPQSQGGSFSGTLQVLIFLQSCILSFRLCCVTLRIRLSTAGEEPLHLCF